MHVGATAVNGRFDRAAVASIGTYLPPWLENGRRVPGDDEDAVTMAVAAGLAALNGAESRVETVVLVTRDFPLVRGGNAAALLAGLGLDPATEVVERLGGAPETIEALATAAAGTLVIGADAEAPAGAGAILVGSREAGGMHVAVRGWVNRSLPVVARDGWGRVHDYGDPRLLRERGLRASLSALRVEGPVAAVAGCDPRDVPGASRDVVSPPTTGASAPVFALAELVERGGALVVADQATVGLADVVPGSVKVSRDELPGRRLPAATRGPEAEIPISLAAYERAFDAKLRLEGSRCSACGTLAYPRRYRCLGCGREGDGHLEPLPREAVVYSTTTVHVPVPGLTTPYTLVLVELGTSGVRFLTRLTAGLPGEIAIGDRGYMVFRRIAVRSGVPDYGYAFRKEVRQ